MGRRGDGAPQLVLGTGEAPSPEIPVVASAAAFTRRAPWRASTSKSLHLARDRHAVVRDERPGVADVEDDVAPSRTERHLDRVGDRIDAREQPGARVGPEVIRSGPSRYPDEATRA